MQMTAWKCALVYPLLKKCKLETINTNFHPVCNLQFISKLTEKAAATQIEFQILLITFKAIKGLAPKYLSDVIEILQMLRYNLRCNNNGILLARSTIRTKKTMGDRAFMIAAPILWNSLPLSVRQAATVDNF